MANKTIGGCVRTPVRTPFATWIIRNVRPQHWRRLWELFYLFIRFSHQQRWPHLPKANHPVEGGKMILNGGKPLKKDSWQVRNN
ncbi:hypothetical protein AAG906_033774 [Vitis piasezkii]